MFENPIPGWWKPIGLCDGIGFVFGHASLVFYAHLVLNTYIFHSNFKRERFWYYAFLKKPLNWTVHCFKNGSRVHFYETPKLMGYDKF